MIFLFMHIVVSAQQKEKDLSNHKIMAGAEILWYPAGWITGPTIAYYAAPKHLLSAGIGVNIANRHDWGKHEDEKGTGFGGSVGYRYLFAANKNSFFIGARVDLWSTKINWKDKIGTPQAINGTTKTTVFQPTAHIGYLVAPKNSRLNFLFSAGGGAEINIKTKGKDVGEGGMWLVGVAAYYKF